MGSGLLKAVENLGAFRQMPILFIGHGNPMNANEENGYSRNWAALGQNQPAARATRSTFWLFFMCWQPNNPMTVSLYSMTISWPVLGP